ncbi:MAG: hypothetical protein AAB494_00410 [Patescibacteria group bacterium]
MSKKYNTRTIEEEQAEAIGPQKSESISWHAPEYEYSPKSSMWYWTSLFLVRVTLF